MHFGCSSYSPQLSTMLQRQALPAARSVPRRVFGCPKSLTPPPRRFNSSNASDDGRPPPNLAPAPAPAMPSFTSAAAPRPSYPPPPQYPRRPSFPASPSSPQDTGRVPWPSPGVSASPGNSLPRAPPRISLGDSGLFSNHAHPSFRTYPFSPEADRDKLQILGLGAPITESLFNKPGQNRAAELGAAPPIALRPVSGRTVHVLNTMDPVMALRTLQRQINVERLQRISRLQRFHERPGLKRKRQKSERWRARFKAGFCATVKRVQELARQGW